MRPTRARRGARRGIAYVLGQGLRQAVQVVSRVRRTRRPLHPRGTLWHAEVVRFGSGAHTGVAWLDGPGTDDALVRVSRALGLPRNLPDIQGLAIRLLGTDVAGDLLLATTGGGPWSRYVLRPTRARRPGIHTSLLPYDGPRGRVLLAALPRGEHRYALAHASAGGPWQEFAELVLEEVARIDVRFDPVLHPLPGLRVPAWVRRLREPSYSTARATGAR